MKFVHAMIFTILFLGSLSAQAGQPIINLSVGGEIAPGVYGQVQFGNAPPPAVVYEQPQIVNQQPAGVVVKPIYLHVPPEHAKNWAKHCREYKACNRPVYFVKSREYASDYRAHKEERREEGRRDERQGEDRRGEERRDDERRDDRRRE